MEYRVLKMYRFCDSVSIFVKGINKKWATVNALTKTKLLDRMIRAKIPTLDPVYWGYWGSEGIDGIREDILLGDYESIHQHKYWLDNPVKNKWVVIINFTFEICINVFVDADSEEDAEGKSNKLLDAELKKYYSISEWSDSEIESYPSNSCMQHGFADNDYV